jgi:hypothetical protein
MVLEQELVIDEAKVKRAVQQKIPLVLTTFTLPRKIERYIEKVVTVFLEQTKRENLADYIIYCVQELVVNAKKANTKRVYFMERGLDLDDPLEYDIGMVSFKEDTLNNIERYMRLQKEQGLYIKIILQITDRITIEVRNNSAITETELDRIRKRLKHARQFDSLDDAVSHVLDDSEGSGLGLVILVLMLKKLGLDETCFDISETGRETVARIIIPFT